MSASEPLPTDIESCHALIEETNRINQSLATELQSVKDQLQELKRFIYGRRSERHVPDDSQLSLFESEEDSRGQADTEPEALEEEITYRRRKRRQTERFPEQLERQVQVIDVDQAERKCGCCGEEMPIIATDVRERLEYVPARMFVHELHYPKRACGKCKQGVAVASPPESNSSAAALTKGSRYGFGVTAQIILGKYCDHLPLYRLEDVFARAGVVIPRSTQVDLLAAAADLLAPLARRMRQQLLESPIIGLDDTPVRLQDASLPGQMKTARMWLARGRDDAPYNVFFFHDSRERAGPAKFLQGFTGTVTVDAYGVDDGVYLGSGGRILASCCHAHVRRKFEAAKGNDPRRAAYALAFYRKLFDIEDRGAGLEVDERLELRRGESASLMGEFKSWLDQQRGATLPKSAIGKAVRYALNQWEPLSRFLSDGRLPIHNNDTERDLRRLTVGRKNWLFLGSEAGGELAAVLYTITGSAHRHGLDL